MNPAALMARAGKVWPERPALALGTATWASYAALARRVAVRAGRLRERFAMRPGDRVVLAMTNSPEYIEALYAVWHAGLAAVPVNAKLHPREIDYIIEHSEAKLALTTADLTAAFGGTTPVVTAGDDQWRRLAEGDPLPLAEIDDHSLAWQFYTSGTTGRPKGAMLSPRNLHAMTYGYLAEVDTVGPTDAILHVAPISHGSGLYNFAHVLAGAVQVIPESGGFDPAETFALIEAFVGTSFFAAPTIVRRLVDSPAAAAADTANLKTIIYGGAPMYVADLKKAMNRLGPKLAQIYGQGESPMTITLLSKAMHADRGHPRYEERLGSVGVAPAGVEVRVTDAQGRPLPAGEIGEICVRGEVVMGGYWRNPEASAEALRGGWLHTGDVGVFDEDGFLTLKDRSKDLIISGGSNIYPREVEEVLLTHPGVAEVSVVGRSHPDWGEEVVAFVVPTSEAAVAAGELDALCLDRIARFKRPKHYRFVDALPKNNYGKVLKTELRARLAENDKETSPP